MNDWSDMAMGNGYAENSNVVSSGRRAAGLICELFYVCCDDIQDIELCTALSSLVSIFMEGLRTEAIKRFA